MSNIIVGISGGVDSSVAAAKLQEQGHHMTGLFMKNWEEDDTTEYCSAAVDLEDAKEVCKQLGIELKTVNFSYEYWTRVFQVFLSEYRRGRTPNPDVICNKEIKFKEFLKWAIHLGADSIATGHYSRISIQDRYYLLRKGHDAQKDQSYFLHTLNQEMLKYAHFPLGEICKNEVRKIAKNMGLRIHSKKDSTGICFIGERQFSKFLNRFLPAQIGKIKTLDGKTIGSHQGVYYYTIGQRKGLGIGGKGEPWYVSKKNVNQNILYVVQGKNHSALMKTMVLAEQLHWVIGDPPRVPTVCKAKIRYRHNEQPCIISKIDQHSTTVEFDEPQWAVTPGQSIVFYQDDVCIGGGIIRLAW